jgi:hypothetical protein
MKKSLSIFAFLILLAPAAFSQYTTMVTTSPAPDKGEFYHRFEITPMVGYQFGGKVNFMQGDFKMYDNINYGINLDLLLGRAATLEFSYTRMDSHAEWMPFYGYGGDYPAGSFNFASNYFQFGVLKEGYFNRVRPYGLFTLGVAWLDLKDANVSDAVNFSVALGAGCKVFLSKVIGLRFQGRLLLPMYFGGVGFFFNSSGGSGLTVSSTSPYVQGDFSAGLIFALGK